MTDPNTPPPASTKLNKGGFFKKPAWLEQQLKSQAKPEDKKKDATDIFSRSADSYEAIRAEQKRNEEKKAKATREECAQSKRRRVSTEAENEDADAPARKTSTTPSKRSLSLRNSNSPQSLSQRYEAVASAAALPKKKAQVVAIDSDDEDEDEDSLKPVSIAARSNSIPKHNDEPEYDPDEEFPELAAKARERAREREKGKKHNSGVLNENGMSASLNPALDESLNPIISIFIEPRIPGTTPLLVRRKWNQRLKEIRTAWCDRQTFVKDFADTVILTWRGRRVFDVASCKSLGIQLDIDGQPILSGGKDGFDDAGDKLVLVATTQAIVDDEKRAAIEAERRREEEANGITAPVPKAFEKKKIKIILNAKDYEPHKLIVMEDTTIERIAGAFRRQYKVPDDMEITLMFDGEALDPSGVMKDTEIEDMECIEVHIK